MKKTLKILLIVVLAVAVLGIAYFSIIKLQEKSALKTVDEMFIALKTGNYEEIKKYVNPQETSNENKATENIAEDEKMTAAMVKNVTYEVIQKDTKLNNCKIKLNVSNKDLKTIFANYFTQAFSLAFSQAFGNISEEEMNAQLEQYLMEQYESESIGMITNELEIEMVRKDGKWDMICDQEKLINAILPGFNEIMKSFEESDQ